MLGIEASLIRPPAPQPPPVVETVDAGVAQDSADAVFMAATLVRPSYPPDNEASDVVPDDQTRDPEFSSRA
jgi:hypothetical protein